MVTNSRPEGRRKAWRTRDPSDGLANGKKWRSCRVQLRLDGKRICLRVVSETSVRIAVNVSGSGGPETNGSMTVDPKARPTPSLFDGVVHDSSSEETVLEKRDNTKYWYPPMFQVIKYGEEGTPIDGSAVPLDWDDFLRLSAQTVGYPAEKAPANSAPGSVYSVLILNGEVAGAAPFSLKQ